MHGAYEGRLNEVRSYLLNLNSEISRLTSDLRNSQDANRSLANQYQQLQTKFMENTASMEEKVCHLNT